MAVPATGTPEFVAALERLWDAGDAVLPLDPRLPAPAAERLLDTLAPAAILDLDGTTTARGAGRDVEDGDALVVATSGSTGDPKGVVLTHDALRASSAATSERLAIDPGTDRWLACLPLAHVGGLGVVVRALHTGTPLDVLPRPDANAVADAVRRGATRTALVPTVLGRIDTSDFRTVLLGGAATPRDVPPNVVTTYGMTETGGGIVYDGHPLAGVEIRSTDGRLAVRAPMLGRAYRAADGDVPLADDDGWFATGDAGTVNPDGVVVHGRVGDMIITGGENVWPQAVEDAVATLAGVAAVAVVGRADPTWGQAVTAVVVPTDPHAPPSLEAVRAHVRATLPAHAAPTRLELVEALPRTPLGKLRRHLI